MGFNGDSMGFNGIGDGMPSGNLLQFAIENGPVEIVDLPSYFSHGGSFHSYVVTFTRPGIWGFPIHHGGSPSSLDGDYFMEIQYVHG